MKTTAMITLAGMLGSSAWAAAKSDAPKVEVCYESGDHEAAVANVASATASRLMRSAGVKLDWDTKRLCHVQRDKTIIVTLSTDTPRTLCPGALAYALPYEGVHIQVFYDRIAVSDPDLVPYLLANVVVHEIAHILQGIDRHSDSGIMKARWTAYDFTMMKRHQLGFTDFDVELIQGGLAARAARGVTGTLVAANAR
jgi:hypothetical protein